MKQCSDKFFWFLLLLLGFNLGFRVYSYRIQYSTPYDPVYWRERYLKSQWVMAEPEEPIGDDGLYAYAGWEYIHGRDPSMLNAEMPPLGKYLVGLSIMVFNNQNIFAFICGFLVLFTFFQFNKLIFPDRLCQLLAVVLFSFEPLFWQQLRAPYLDLLYLLFLLLIFYFFLQERLFLAAVFLGLMTATKASPATFLLVGLVTSAFLVCQKKWSWLRKWLLFLPVSLIIFSLIYFRYFQLGHNLRDFLGLQKWILEFYQQGVRGKLGAIWPMLFFGRWQTWWQPEAVKVAEWSLSWSLLTIVFLFSVLRLKKIWQAKGIFLVCLWLTIYLVFLNFIPLWPRYLLIFLPFGYNLLTWHAAELIKKIS